MDTTYRHPISKSTFPFDLAAGAESLPPKTYARTDSSTSFSTELQSEDDELEATPPTTANVSADELDCDEPTLNLSRRRPGDEWAPRKVSPKQDTTDWLWMMTEEPHRSRRKAVLKAHPEVSF